jgi:hypothetical protein
MRRPAPDAAIITGVLLTTVGYLLPWFRLTPRYEWWYSGTRYLSEGAGWTGWVCACLFLTLVAGLWAGTSLGAAMAAMTAAGASALFAVAVVAFSFAQYNGDRRIDWAQDMPFGIGLPVLAAGFGLLAAACVRAVAVNAFTNPTA